MPAIGRSDLPIMSLIRSAAASDNRITCGRGRGVGPGMAMVLSPLRPSGRSADYRYLELSHHMFNTTLASSDIRLGSQGGSHTTLTVTGPTPGTLAAAFSTMLGSSCADGQLGVVNVMSIEMARSSPISIL